MTFFYDVPALGPVKNGRQTIRVYDSKLGGMREITTTPEQVEEFISEKNQATKQATKKGLLAGVGMYGIGAVIGAAIGEIKEKAKVKKLNNLVNQINPEFEGACQKYVERDTPQYWAKQDVLWKEPFHKYRRELEKLFDEGKNTFVKVSPKEANKFIKRAVKIGSMYGSNIVWIPAMFAVGIMRANAKEKATQNFINENKEINQYE